MVKGKQCASCAGAGTVQTAQYQTELCSGCNGTGTSDNWILAATHLVTGGASWVTESNWWVQVFDTHVLKGA